MEVYHYVGKNSIPRGFTPHSVEIKATPQELRVIKGMFKYPGKSGTETGKMFWAVWDSKISHWVSGNHPLVKKVNKLEKLD